jgi:hypothetical protein
MWKLVGPLASLLIMVGAGSVLAETPPTDPQIAHVAYTAKRALSEALRFGGERCQALTERVVDWYLGQGG